MEALWNMGIKTLMVEGGATVIESFINSAHVDSLVITISPTVVGAAGVGYNCDGEQVVLILTRVRPSCYHVDLFIV